MAEIKNDFDLQIRKLTIERDSLKLDKEKLEKDYKDQSENLIKIKESHEKTKKALRTMMDFESDLSSSIRSN